MIARATFQLVVPKRSKNCQSCEKAFDGGEQAHSLVREGEDEQMLREDYCLVCWEKEHIERSEAAVTHWATKFPDSAKLKEDLRMLSRKERAFVLLRGANAREDEKSKQEAFVLALFLAHGRVLVLRRELRRADGVYNLYENGNTGETFCVRQCDLAAVDVEAVQKDLAAKMRGEIFDEEQETQDEQETELERKEQSDENDTSMS